ncbi:hypothetical protein N7G274_008833 [Stereocaulon virgatum]|uniref:Uncharacterized protein n=1 Tax=Stereocaulon virgatum TaxID=373712 RepID=A0ABR4A138_9LECA
MSSKPRYGLHLCFLVLLRSRFFWSYVHAMDAANLSTNLTFQSPNIILQRVPASDPYTYAIPRSPPYLQVSHFTAVRPPPPTPDALRCFLETYIAINEVLVSRGNAPIGSRPMLATKYGKVELYLLGNQCGLGSMIGFHDRFKHLLILCPSRY